MATSRLIHSCRVEKKEGVKTRRTGRIQVFLNNLTSHSLLIMPVIPVFLILLVP
jgi:hypothetical protein